MAHPIGTAEMGTPLFLEFKKQASSYLREKIRTARLALTDVTPAELLAEEATMGESIQGPDARTLRILSRAAFEVDDYWRIVDLVHRKLARTDRKYWRESYNALSLLECLLTTGPRSVLEEFQGDKEAIRKLGFFGYVDERGFNWGLAVKRKSERVLRMLEEGSFLAEERERSRKLARGIQGFGSCKEGTAANVGTVADRPRALEKANSLCEAGVVESLLGGGQDEEEELNLRNVNVRLDKVPVECSLEESRPLLCCQ